VFAVNADYYLTHNLSDLMARPNDIKSIGFLKNPNREITLDDFKQKMTGRKKIQEKVYQSLITPFIETDEAPKKRENIFNKLLQIIKQ